MTISYYVAYILNWNIKTREKKVNSVKLKYQVL